MNRSNSSRKTQVPFFKGAMRAVWRLLPRSKLSYDLGKAITRTILRPSTRPRPVEARFGGRILMQMDLGDFTDNELFCLDTHYESVTMDLWRKLAGNSSVVVDVGSHIGTFALLAADANPQAKVIAIEADGDNFSLLREHCARYPNVKPVHAAIADRSTELWFCPDSTNTGGGYLTETAPEGRDCYRVETRPLDDVCRSEGVQIVDLMKIDVEGYEHTLLAQDSKFWHSYRPQHLLVEVKRGGPNEANSEALFATMRHRGYAARRIQGLYAAPLMKADDLANWHFWLRQSDEEDS